jgi:hypothetical protein
MFLVALNRLIIIWFFLYGVIAYSTIKLTDVITTHYDGLEAAFGVLLFSFIIYTTIQSVVIKNTPQKNQFFDKLEGVWYLFFLTIFFLLIINQVNYFDIIFKIIYIPVFTFLLISNKKKYFLITIHVVFFLILINLNIGQEYILDSKEKIFIFIFFPFLIKFLVKKDLKVVKLLKISLIFIVFITLASLVVNSNRNNLDIDFSQKVLIDRFSASIERLMVIDTLAAIVQNEEEYSPKRPSQPLWTLAGSVAGIMPWIDSRPIHPKEMLKITKYNTSSDDVRVAGTVFGHILWSYGWFWLVPSIIFFWVFYHFLIIAISMYSKKSASMAYIAIMLQVPRLESTADSFLSGSLLIALVYLILSFYLRIRWK